MDKRGPFLLLLLLLISVCAEAKTENPVNGQCTNPCMRLNKKGKKCIPKNKNADCVTINGGLAGLCRGGTCRPICEVGDACGVPGGSCICPVREGVQCLEGVCQGPQPCSPFTIKLTWGAGAEPAPTRVLHLAVTDPDQCIFDATHLDGTNDVCTVAPGGAHSGTGTPLTESVFLDPPKEGKYEILVDFSDETGGLQDVEFTVVKVEADLSETVLVPPTSTGTEAGSLSKALLVGACEAE